MQKIIVILLLLISVNSFSQHSQKHLNLIIGKDAGKLLTNESHCIIIGHGDSAIKAKGKDMIWVVDWNERFINDRPVLKNTLLDYYEKHVKKGTDTKDSRKDLILNIRLTML